MIRRTIDKLRFDRNRWLLSRLGGLFGIALISTLGLAAATQAVSIDGFLSPGEYSYIYAIDYEYGGDRIPVSGGVVAFATDASGDHYLYYQVPTDLVDNTWGCVVGTGETCTQIGDYRDDGHTFQRLRASDSFGALGNRMVLRGTSVGDIKFQVDLLASTLKMNQAPGSGAQAFLTGGFGNAWLGTDVTANQGFLQDPQANAGFFLDVMTSSAWNILNFGPGGTGAISQSDLDGALLFLYKQRPGVFRDSPATDANYSNPTVDNPIAPDGMTLYDDSLFSGWNYLITFEMKIDGSLFPSGEWTDPANHQLVPCGDGENCLAILDFGGAHFSNNKLGYGYNLNPVGIVLIPEPGTLLLLGLGIGGLAALGRRRLS
jgi:hypothetical protein